VYWDHARDLATYALEHLVGRHHELGLTARGKTHWDVERIRFIAPMEILVFVDQVSGEHPSVAGFAVSAVAHDNVLGSGRVRVEGGMQIDMGKDVLPDSVDCHETAGPSRASSTSLRMSLGSMPPIRERNFRPSAIVVIQPANSRCWMKNVAFGKRSMPPI
jgi:hypothetical protein